MVFVGVDLAADPRRTGLAIINDGDRCVLEHVTVGVGDEVIIGAAQSAERVGVDIPLGWPERFVELLRAHTAGALAAPDSTGPEWRRGLAMRATDLVVHRRTGLTPLSVSTDRIAHPALRWAGIEAHLRELGVDTTRDGSGVICEVYPAAALRCWSLPYRGYKTAKNSGPRAELVKLVRQQWTWLDWNGHEELCVTDDNALDAVLAAVIAREIELGRCEAPPAELRSTAHREGWIWLPREEEPAGTCQGCDN
jgi:predicted nuclease with RNAse H fold